MAIQTNTLPVTQPPTTSQTPASVNEYDCDFEKACSWSSDPNNTDYEWAVIPALSFDGIFSKPTVDHTFQQANKGYYLGVRSKNVTSTASAVYVSPLMNGTSKAGTYKCLEFWYYLYGAEVIWG